MSLFKEEEVLSENQHEQLDIAALEIGESIAFYFDNTADRTSAEYGDFIVCQGLKVELEHDGLEELLAHAQPASFIPNKLLVNKIDDGSMITGELYRIEKAWDKGQVFSDKKKAKGWGYKVFHLSADPATRAAFSKAYKAALSKAKIEEDPVEVSETKTAKPAV